LEDLQDHVELKRPSIFAGVSRRLRSQASLLFDRYRITAAEKAFLAHNRGAATAAAGDPLVLVEAVEDHYYLALFARIAAGLATHRTIRFHQIPTRSLRPGATRSLWSAAKSLLFYNSWTDRKWIRLYGAFCPQVAYRSAARSLSRDSLADFIKARKIWRALTSSESLLGLTVHDVRVGDLIYDTYLRFKPAATVNLKSRYLLLVIWQALREIRAARGCMRAKPAMLLTTYSTYIQHGVVVRVALASGIEVMAFGNYQEFYKRLRADDWVHTRNPDNYRAGFARLENATTKLAQAERALSGRLSGKSDMATAYMQRSTYTGSADLPTGVSGSLVLFLHDFFDSPHCYRWMIFQDFWEWATFTLNFALEAGIKVFVKPHPNQIASSRTVVRTLKANYPESTWLSVDTSNLQLAEAGMACAITIYGTVAHEMAYLGIPCVAAGHNPHISFDFCQTARDRDEYCRLIRNYRNLRRSPGDSRRESLEFYVMHNLTVTEDQARLRDAVIRFRSLVNSEGGWLRDGKQFLAFEEELDREPAFREACAELQVFLIP
jgi:hypothetical protein